MVRLRDLVGQRGAVPGVEPVAGAPGIIENLGDPLAFEAPYWAGAKALEVDDGDAPYPLRVHPLELAEDALRTLFGFNYEGVYLDDDPDLESVVLAGFRVEQPNRS